MISDVTALFNLSLNAIGARSDVASPTEVSREAQVCSLWYSVVRDVVFAASQWPELTRLASLEVLDERDPEVDWTSANARPGYTYAYAMPSDALRPQYLTNFDRFLVTAYGTDSSALQTNTPSAVLAYTGKNVPPAQWGAGLGMAMVYALASHIVMPLTGKVTRAKQLVDQANSQIMIAREIASNTSNETFDFIPDWIAARGFAGAQVSQRYVYPNGDLLMVGNV